MSGGGTQLPILFEQNSLAALREESSAEDLTLEGRGNRLVAEPATRQQQIAGQLQDFALDGGETGHLLDLTLEGREHRSVAGGNRLVEGPYLKPQKTGQLQDFTLEGSAEGWSVAEFGARGQGNKSFT